MIARKPLSVSLTPELHAFVTHLVNGGGYANSSEVVRAGLRLLKRDEAQRQPGSLLGAPSASKGRG